MINQQTVERIKEAARIEDVVGEFVPLKKRGSRLLGLCPFHQEKTPSFNVNTQLNIYKCFGCGKAGDAISFLQEHEHLSYVEALRWLAERYQIPVEEKEATPEQKAESDHRESLMIVNHYAAGWFADCLRNSDEGRAVGLAYFQERGLREDTISAFGLGWCPESGDAFSRAATAAGYQSAFLEELGLSRMRDGHLRDFYRARVIFPIHNAGGKAIAFGARTLRDGPGIPKYLNSPESVVYNKSAVLYGLFQAKRAISEHNMVYLVEGYMDVLSMHQGGIRQTVAASGTALTPEQLKLIRRYTPNLTLVYDGDAAGAKAAMRGIELALEAGLQVRIAALPPGEDPDSMVRRIGGAAVQEYLQANTRDFVLYRAELLRAEAGADPIRRAEGMREILTTISLVSDPLQRALFLRQAASLLDMDEALLIRETNKLLQERLRKQGPSQARPEEPLPQPAGDEEHLQQTATDPGPHRELDLIRLLLEAGDFTIEEQPAVQVILEQIADVELEHHLYARVLSLYREAWSEGRLLMARHLLEHEHNELRELAMNLLNKPWELSPNWTKRHEIAITDKKVLIRRDAEKVITALKAHKIDTMLSQVLERIRETSDEAELRHYQGLYQQLRENRARLSEAAGQMLVKRIGKT